jgi:hypothetical protein
MKSVSIKRKTKQNMTIKSPKPIFSGALPLQVNGLYYMLFWAQFHAPIHRFNPG